MPMRHRSVQSVLSRMAIPQLVAAPLLATLFLRQGVGVLLAMAGACLAWMLAQKPATTAAVLIPLSVLCAALDITRLFAALIAALTAVMSFKVATGAVSLRRVHLWIGALAGLLLISYLVPSVPSPEAQDARLGGLVGILAGLALLATTVFSPPEPRQITRLTAFYGTIVAAYVLIDGEYTHDRLTGIGLNSNYLGMFLALPLVASVGMLQRSRNIGWLCPAAACLTAIVETGSRGALVSATAGIAFLVLNGRPVVFQVLTGAALPATARLFPGWLRALEDLTMGGRGADELVNNTEVRSQVARFAASVALAHPVRGIGLGTFESHAAKAPGFGIYMATHNDYFRLAAEAGIPALVVLLIILWTGLAARQPVAERPELTVLRALGVCYLTSLLFGNPLANITYSTPFWLALGCLLHAASLSRPATTTDPSAGSTLAADRPIARESRSST